MADQNEDPSSEQEEKKIPVFTVLKNSSILKNIFLMDKPPSISDSDQIGHVYIPDVEEMLLVGRHPDCNIKLEHPSISRHHLQIYSKPSSLDLAVVDLFSVHGTWICGKKVEPGVRVHLKEGDSMQLGGSSRVYMLHWVPLSRVYDLDDPFVPPIEDEDVDSADGIVEEAYEDEEFISGEDNEIQLIGDGLGSSKVSLSNRNLKSCLKKVSLSGPRLLEFQQASDGDDDEFRGFCAPVEEISQEEDTTSPRNNEIQSLGAELGSSKLSLSNKNLKSCLKKVSLSEPRVLEFQQASFDDEDDELQELNTLVEEIINETPQEEDSMSPGNDKIHPMHDELGSPKLSLTTKNLKSYLKKVSLSEPRVLEFQQASFNDDDDEFQRFNALVEEIIEEIPQEEDSMYARNDSIQLVNDDLGSSKLSLSNNNLKSCSSPSKSCELEFQHASSDDDDKLQDYYALGIEEILQEEGSKSPGNIHNQLMHDELGSSKLSLSSEHLNTRLEKVCSSPLSVQELPHSSSDDENKKLFNVENQIPILESPEVQEQYFMSCEDNQFQLTGTEVESLNTSFSNKNMNLCLKKVSADNNEVLQELDVGNEIPDPEPPVALENMQVLEHSPVNENEEELRIKSEPPQLSTLVNELCLTKSPSPVSSSVNSAIKDQCISIKENSSEPDSENLSRTKFRSQDEDSKQSDLASTIRALFFSNKDHSNSNEENSSKHDSDNLSNSEYRSGDEDEDFIETELASTIRALFFRNNTSPLSSTGYSTIKDQSNSNKETSSEPDSENLSETEYDSEDEDSKQMETGSEIRGLFLRKNTSPVSSIVNSTIKDQSNSNDENSTVKKSSEPDGENLSRTEYHSHDEDSEEQSWISNIWSRRGKPTTVQVDLFDTLSNESITNALFDGVAIENFAPDKEVSNKSITYGLFDEEAEENFTPDKENYTPKNLQKRSRKKKNKMEELKSFEKLRKEQDLVKRNRDVTRVPFKSLVAQSTSTEKSDIGGKTKKWLMVVDTSCLLNKESRKSIKLLLGLKGTKLIIPQIVLSELESMKQQRSFFSRETESCAALKWIEECLMKNDTKQWIHILSSSEDESSFPPTPTASPATACSSLLEILSPVSPDHVLECALALNRTKNDPQLHVVLLSNNVTMKIKAMAEGLLCEEAKEFREKLVNPFTERFLWGGSWPRGLTWTCKDDVILKEIYARKTASIAGSVKGLKLILQYSKHDTC